MAREVFARACQALGWGIAQAITLVAPEVVVIGGGVSLADESLFLAPLRQEVAAMFFLRWRTSSRSCPPAGRAVVVHGALAAAAALE